jgi:hypothetical protein
MALIDSLALEVAQNEALAQPMNLTTKSGASQVPMNLTGGSFFAQVRKKQSATSDLIATLSVEIVDAAAGSILIKLASAITKDLAPGRYVYDILFRPSALGEPDNLWAAPFVVLPAVSVWPTP